MPEIQVTIVKRGKRRAYGLRWKDELGQTRERSSGTKDYREAVEAAKQLEAEFAARVIHQQTWEHICKQYEDRHLARKSDSNLEAWLTSKRLFNEFAQVNAASEITAKLLYEFHEERLAAGNSPTTAKQRVTYILGCLSWACDHELIDKVPKIKLRGKPVPGGRPIVREEFDRILAAAPKVRPYDYEEWLPVLWGLWHSGARIGELSKLSWDETEPCAIIKPSSSNEYPLLRIDAVESKNGQTTIRPCGPEMWKLLCETRSPASDRAFPMFDERSKKFVVRVIGQIGKKAGVITCMRKKSFASSHDIGRRSFATRHDGILTMTEIRVCLGQATGRTALETSYLLKDARDINKKLWRTSQGQSQGHSLVVKQQASELSHRKP